LRDEGVLIIGSGQSFHNLRLHGAAARQASEVFDQWLQKAMALPQTAQRHQALIEWAQAPAARLAHPREEHLLPLMVIAGAAGDDAAHLIFRNFWQIPEHLHSVSEIKNHSTEACSQASAPPQE
jgi:aromatic ring-opening dioxygenase catalytic subunit (LigB family)